MKPNSFTKLYAHFVFSPKGRRSLLIDPVMEKVQKYIYGIIQEKKCYPIAINGMADHIHILVGLNPVISISDLIRDIKRSSTLYINNENLLPVKFAWQEGYAAFTVGYKDLDHVYKYVLNQKEHHSRKNFRNEYLQILTDQGFEDYNDYLFEFYE